MKPSRNSLKKGMEVGVIQKGDQKTGVITKGRIESFLTRSPTHPHGIKVRLETGEVGRVQFIITDATK